ncbi:MAG: hypothetical protein JO349_10150 [Candidatus Eremiobacteraeota bacterium]|nr:hypothetical protein [Candidatus Eremiobacteraeota bacterium]
MSLAVVNLGGSSAAANVATSFLADLNISSTQSAQIEQILAELQSGVISPVEARAQIASVVTSQQQTGGSAGSPSAQSQSLAAIPVEPLTQYYQLPLPQESLKGAIPSYNAHGAATETVFSTPKTVNASA